MLLIKSLGAMVLVLGLIFFGAWGARKLGFGSVRSTTGEDPIDLKILSTVAVGSGRTIAAVSFAGRVFLVGSTPNSFTLLAEEDKNLPDSQFRPRSVAEMLRDESTFGEEMERALATEA
jgi:flagellar biogenesis protein FliO